MLAEGLTVHMLERADEYDFVSGIDPDRFAWNWIRQTLGSRFMF